jgi:Aspartyl/Asparaginyl beta-hydroxylase
MNNFKKICELDIQPLATEIMANANLWVKGRKDIKPWQGGYQHRHIEVLPLKVQNIPKEAQTDPKVFEMASHDIVAHDLPNFALFPETRRFIYRLMEIVGGLHVGRTAFVNLPAGKKIDGHYDTGFSAEYFTRYHVMINGSKSNWMQCGEGDDTEWLEMMTGECWTFAHQKWHEFHNRSDQPRIYLNIDIR